MQDSIVFALRWLRFVSICLLFIGILTSCVTPTQARRRVVEARQAVPEMPGAELLIEEVAIASGSQDNCVGAQYIIVYGSDETFDQGLSFYQNNLLESGWEDVSADYIVPMFQKDKNYFLSVTEEDLERILLFIDQEHYATLEARANQFSTLFLIRIGFTTCPSG